VPFEDAVNENCIVSAASEQWNQSLSVLHFYCHSLPQQLGNGCTQVTIPAARTSRLDHIRRQAGSRGCDMLPNCLLKPL
jgi:hypothetical protein